MVEKAFDLQRSFLLLGALVTFVLFAPRGILVGLTVIALIAARLPQSLLGRIRHRRRAFARYTTKAAASALGGYIDPIVEGSGDGDWGPALVLVFDARDPVTGQQRLRIQVHIDSESGEAWTLDPVPLDSSLGAAPGAWQGDEGPMACNEILKRLHNAGFEYRLGPSRGGE